jgi:hypothetical protein
MPSNTGSLCHSAPRETNGPASAQRRLFSKPWSRNEDGHIQRRPVPERSSETGCFTPETEVIQSDGIFTGNICVRDPAKLTMDAREDIPLSEEDAPPGASALVDSIHPVGEVSVTTTSRRSWLPAWGSSQSRTDVFPRQRLVLTPRSPISSDEITNIWRPTPSGARRRRDCRSGACHGFCNVSTTRTPARTASLALAIYLGSAHPS